MTKLEKVIKELCWLQFNFPWQDNPENDADKMSNAIHKYTGDALKLLKERQWISVKDRLPEHGKRYLIYATSGDGKEHYITIAAYGGHFALSGRCAYWKVTHWMPLQSTEELPEPPKEEAEDVD